MYFGEVIGQRPSTFDGGIHLALGLDRTMQAKIGETPVVTGKGIKGDACHTHQRNGWYLGLSLSIQALAL